MDDLDYLRMDIVKKTASHYITQRFVSSTIIRRWGDKIPDNKRANVARRKKWLEDKSSNCFEVVRDNIDAIANNNREIEEYFERANESNFQLGWLYLSESHIQGAEANYNRIQYSVDE